MRAIATRIKSLVIVGTALVAVLALPSAAWAANPLALTKTIPNGGATEVAPTVNVKAYFNHDMRASTVTSSTFKIREQGTTTWLAATRSVNNTISPTSTNGGSQSVATLNPNADLASNTTYQVVVVGGSSGVRDTDGKALSANKSWTFTTVTPPETTIDSGPEDTVASDSATFSFSSSKSGSTFQCSLDGSAFEGCTSPQSYSSLSQGPHTFRVRAIDARGNVDRTPASHSWTVDTIGPNAVIGDGPPSQFNSRSATFTFAGAEDGGGYQCKIDDASSEGAFAACSSGETFTVEADGTYTFSLRASDALGNFGKPASQTWTVDTVGPAAPSAHLDASSDSGSQNDNITKDTTPTISGTAEAGSTVKIYNAENFVVASVRADDAGTWSYSFGALTPDGSHSYTVKTTDAAGNESQGASISLTIDTTAPETTLGDKPASPLNSGSARFTFSSSESGSSFECSRDGSAFVGCDSPQSYTGLADGSHTFRVRAVDVAGNVDPTPADHTWTVETAAPTITNFSPSNTEAHVALSANVMATFSEAMDSDSISGQTFTLTQQGSSDAVPATVSYNSTTKRATLNPSTDLALHTTYTATLTTGVKDLAGNTIEERSWTFTTGDGTYNVTVTPTKLTFGSSGLCPIPPEQFLEVKNNGPGAVTFADVSITGPDAFHFRSGAKRYLEANGPFTVPAGNHFFDGIVFIPAGGSRTYRATLTYKDDNGATIGNPVDLSASTSCIVVG